MVTACTGSGDSGAGSPASGSLSNAKHPDAGLVPGQSSLHWHNCTGADDVGLKCASLKVPVDYSKPGGRKLTLALSMHPATAPKSQQQGIMLVNPGGPGGSGLSLPGAIAPGLSPADAADYDIVGFDPRGVGSSSPELSCEPSFFKGISPDYIPSTKAAETTLVNRAKNYAAGCGKKFGWLLPHMTTKDSARDMDAIRQAFGVGKLSYFGLSYGTYLGEVYGTLFPSRVHRMVLDSTVDPDGVWWADNIDQDYAFQKRLEAFFSWVAANDSSYHLGTSASKVQAAFYKARNEVKAHPADGQVGSVRFDEAFLDAGYSNQTWPGLAQALASYVAGGDPAGLIAQWQQAATQEENENEFAVYNAVQCADVNWPRDWSQWDSATRQVYKKAPFQAWDNAWYNAACAFWPVKGPAKPTDINGKGLPPVLVLQGTLDAATPYDGARNAIKHLPTAHMVVEQGGGNHAEFPPDNDCSLGYLNRYLASGAAPGKAGAASASCPAGPDPSPGG
jgi:pimeloyl-ACP methyl ester carboxylesterase